MRARQISGCGLRIIRLRELEGKEAQVKAAGKLDPELASVIAEAKKVLQDALDNL